MAVSKAIGGATKKIVANAPIVNPKTGKNIVKSKRGRRKVKAKDTSNLSKSTVDFGLTGDIRRGGQKVYREEPFTVENGVSSSTGLQHGELSGVIPGGMPSGSTITGTSGGSLYNQTTGRGNGGTTGLSQEFLDAAERGAKLTGLEQGQLGGVIPTGPETYAPNRQRITGYSHSGNQNAIGNASDINGGYSGWSGTPVVKGFESDMPNPKVSKMSPNEGTSTPIGDTIGAGNINLDDVIASGREGTGMFDSWSTTQKRIGVGVGVGFGGLAIGNAIGGSGDDEY